MTIFISLGPLLFSPYPTSIPKAKSAYNLPTTFIGQNPNNLFGHSPFHSIISDVQFYQNKLHPILVLKLARFFSFFLLPPAWKYSYWPASLSVSQSHTTITGLKKSLFVNLQSQKANSQLHNQSLPSHWHITNLKPPSLLITESGKEKAEAKDNTLLSQYC